jgi:hypothetical protein
MPSACPATARAIPSGDPGIRAGASAHAAMIAEAVAASLSRQLGASLPVQAVDGVRGESRPQPGSAAGFPGSGDSRFRQGVFRCGSSVRPREMSGADRLGQEDPPRGRQPVRTPGSQQVRSGSWPFHLWWPEQPPGWPCALRRPRHPPPGPCPRARRACSPRAAASPTSTVWPPRPPAARGRLDRPGFFIPSAAESDERADDGKAARTARQGLPLGRWRGRGAPLTKQ